MRRLDGSTIRAAIARTSPQSILLLGFLSFVLLVNAEWLAIDHRPPRWDESENLVLAEIAYQRLVAFEWGSLFFSNGTARPNFIPILSALSFPLVGRDVDTTVFVMNSASLLVTSICLYDLGRRLVDRTAALLAVVLYNTLPGVMLFSRYYHMDIPLTAFVTATIWLVLVYAEEIEWRRRLAPLFFVFVAMGMCTKHLYPIYVGLPLAWMLIVLWHEAGWRLLPFLRRHATMIVALLLGTTLGLVYVVVLNYEGFADGVLRSFFTGKSALGAIGYQPPTLMERLGGVEAFEFGGSRWYGALLLLGGLAGIVFWLRRLALVWFWLVGACGFLLFLLGPTDSTYFLATMPSLALVMSTVVAVPRRLSRFATARIATIGLAVIVGLSSVHAFLKSSLDTSSPFAVLLSAPSILFLTKPLETNPLAVSQYWQGTDGKGYIDPLPYPHVWPIDDVLNAIQASTDKSPPDEHFLIGLFSNYEWFNSHAFEYRMKSLGMDRKFQLSLPIPAPANESTTSFLARFDFLIFKTRQILAHEGYPFAREVNAYFDRVREDDYRLIRDAGWRLVKRWPLPDGSEGTVWASADMSKLRLMRSVGAAIPSHRIPGYIVPWQGDVGGDFRRGVLVHPRPGSPVSALTWRGIRIPDGASELTFGIAFAKGVCAEPVAPVRYRIDISEGGRAETVFDHVLELMPCDKSKWSDFAVSLRPWQGKSIDLSISTRPVAGDNISSAHAVWSGLEIR